VDAFTLLLAEQGPRTPDLGGTATAQEVGEAIALQVSAAAQ
jgi:isocitrate/isopropylmalate dehydrogenase